MPHSSKIVTCCYCGSRAALVLRGKERHELACSNCGALLPVLFQLLVRPSPVRVPEQKLKKYRKKRGMSLSQRFMAELKDAAEDIFDDVFDVFD